MIDAITTPTETAIAAAEEAQRHAWHEIRLAMARYVLEHEAAAPPAADLDLLRGALAEYVMAEALLSRSKKEMHHG